MGTHVHLLLCHTRGMISSTAFAAPVLGIGMFRVFTHADTKSIPSMFSDLALQSYEKIAQCFEFTKLLPLQLQHICN